MVLGFAAPEPGSNDFGAMLVIESMLATGLERSGTTSASPDDRAIGALYLDDTKPASFVVFINGAGIDPSVGLREVLIVTHALAARPLSADSLKKLKRRAQGMFLSDSATLVDQSYALGKFVSQGLGNDYFNTAVDAIDAATEHDVQRVAQRYMQKYTAALVLPRESIIPQDH
jgi:predicted Zn-dependent peptidase